MTDTELTKMLRSSANRVVTYAAERIEALTAQLAEDADARALVDARLEQLFNTLLIDVARLQTRAGKAEADNARLTAALTDARPYLERGLDKMAFNIIRAALEGESQ